jgi:GH43 family beta-xylosidase
MRKTMIFRFIREVTSGLLLLFMLQVASFAQCTFTNPVMEGADPHVTYYDGDYYMLVTRGDRVGIKRSSELHRIHEYNEVVVWRFQNTPVGGHVWAPELHQVDGKWYIYTCGQNTGLSSNQHAVNYVQKNQQMFLLESLSDDPLGPYVFKSWLLEGTGAIDETVFTHTDGKQYIIWSQFNFPGQPQSQCNYIAELVNAWTIGDKRVKISCPDEPWERNGWPVNEGATVLQRNGKTYVVYSGSGYTTPEYALGYLLNTDGDLLNASSWTKTGPVFQQNPSGGVYSTGHNSFTVSPDGSEYWNVYHGRLSTDGSTSRYVFLQQYYWHGDEPVFGIPVPVGEAIACPGRDRGQVSSLHMVTDTSRVLIANLSWEETVSLWTAETDKADFFEQFALFKAVPGLANRSMVTFESVEFEGHYLRNNEGTGTLEAFDGTGQYREAATFTERSPWIAGEDYISFESVNMPGRFLSVESGRVVFRQVTEDSLLTIKEAATWKLKARYSVFDCNGDYLGEAFIDSCGICAGGNTGIMPSLDKYDCPATGRRDIVLSRLKVFPNPVTNQLILEFPGNLSGSEATIYDVTGRRSLRQRLDDTRIDVSLLHSGIYFLLISSLGQQYSTVFLKQ